MNDWYEDLVLEQYRVHDRICMDGEDCPKRVEHIERSFVSMALKVELERLQRKHGAVVEALERLRVEADDAYDGISDAVPTTTPEAMDRAHGVVYGLNHAIAVVARAVAGEK